MKLIVGLGNPGRKYQDTRHNVGFEVLRSLHRRFDCKKATAKFESEIVEVRWSDEKVLLQSPLTYMNNSGRAVRAATDFYKMSIGDVLVVCDDFNLKLGRIRFRPSGSAGGQNGLNDIIRHLGSDEISRLRIGIGNPPDQMDVSDYVLSRFRNDELDEIRDSIDRAVQGVELWVQHGIDECMNRFNADPTKSADSSNDDVSKPKNSRNPVGTDNQPK